MEARIASVKSLDSVALLGEHSCHGHVAVVATGAVISEPLAQENALIMWDIK